MTKEEFYEDIRSHIANNYCFPVKAKVTKAYTEKKKYFVDCKELNLDGSESDVIYPKVEVPKFWGNEKGGIFCIPAKDSIVRINFERGNKNFPYVESVLGSSFDIEHKENELLILNDKQKIHLKKNYTLIKTDDNFLIELDKENQKINIVFNENIKFEGSSTGWKMVTQTGTFDLASLIELKNSAGSIKNCLDDLSNLINEVATITSSLATSGNEYSQTAVPGQFIATLVNIANAKSKVATIFK